MNGLVRYTMALHVDRHLSKNELLDKPVGDAFAIDHFTGSVAVSASLEKLAGRLVHYRVTATDRNGAGLSTTLRLFVN